MKIIQFLFKTKKAESLYNRILLLINGLKRYLNEVGGKLLLPALLGSNRVKRYLNEVGGKLPDTITLL